MANSKKSRTKGARSSGKRERDENKARKNRQVSAVVLFAFAILLLCITVIEGGSLWKVMRNILFGLFSFSAFMLSAILFYIAIITALDKPFGKTATKLWQGGLLAVLTSTAIQLFTTNPDSFEGFFRGVGESFKLGVQLKSGGAIGAIVGKPMMDIFSPIGSRIIICLLMFVFLMLVTGTTLMQLINAFLKLFKRFKRKKVEQEEIEEVEGEEETREPKFNINIPLERGTAGEEASVGGELTPLERLERAVGSSQDEAVPKLEEVVVKAAEEVKEKPVVIDSPVQSGVEQNEYVFPPIGLLDFPKGPSQSDISHELKNNAARLIDTLRSFGVEAKIVEISRGPAVTRYELQPAPGVKISKITSLSDDIALNLASAGVRIEAPIPGKAAIGIEVPNKKVNIVSIREIIDTTAFSVARSKLTIALGKDIAGNVTFADIDKMPHLLIAGATGSGKSVCINSIILSLLYKASPQDVRFLMVDPKVVELGVYNGIPHLLVPVVTDPRKAAGALGWAVTEMLERYRIFAENNVRDLKSYNALAEKREGMQKLPQIVIIIDELADLMMVAPNEVEDNICRLAQMARAAGMHLVIATQRPSVDVITGIIKANIPSRIAFAVSSMVDSRTILDMGGAEKLLGRGDMLFHPVGVAKPTRIQGCFVSDNEVEGVVNFIKSSCETEYDENVSQGIDKHAVPVKNKGGGEADEDEFDELLPKAIECVVEMGEASTSMLQRRLRIGYARAGRLMDEMEQRGIIGPHEGSKPRQVLITRNQWLEMSINDDIT